MADKDFVVKNGLVVNTNALVVDGSTNKVGVNTASPDAAFSVVGTANVSGNVALTGSTLTVSANTTLNGNLVVNSNTYFNERIFVGNNNLFVPLYRPVVQAVDNFNGFVQMSSQNLSNASGNSSLAYITINNSGSGYDNTDYIVVSSTLSGSVNAIAAIVTDSSGHIESVAIENVGRYLSSPSTSYTISYAIKKQNGTPSSGIDASLTPFVLNIPAGENSGTDSCSDLVVMADNTDQGFTQFLDIGINNSNFDGSLEYLTVNASADSFALGANLYQANSIGSITGYGLLKARTINGSDPTKRDLIISMQRGYDYIEPTDATYKDLSDGVTNSAVASFSHRNYAFTIGKGNDGYLYVANGALTLGTSEGGRRAFTEQLSGVSFASATNVITVSDTTNLYMDMTIVGTGIPDNTAIQTVLSLTQLRLNKTTTAGSSGTYQLFDRYYDTSGNPIIFHVNGMYAENEVGRFVGNGNFVIGPNTTSREHKFTVAGTANITGNVAFGNNITVAGNSTVTGTISGIKIASGANVSLNTSAMFAGNSISNLIANSTSIVIGTASVNAVINSTAYTGTAYFANNSTYAVNPSNASSLSDGTVPSARISGNYTGITNVGTLGGLTATGNTVLSNFTTNSSISTFGTSNVNFDSGTVFVDATNNRLGVNTASPDTALQVIGNANVSGDIRIGGNFIVAGTMTTVGTTQAQGDLLPLSNTYYLGNTIARWNLTGNTAAMSGNVSAVNIIGTSLNATANISVGGNVVLTNTQVLVGTVTDYSVLSNNKIETTGNVNVTQGVVNVGSNVSISTSTFRIGNSTANIIANSTVIRVSNSTLNSTANLVPAGLWIGNSSVNAVVNSTVYTATAYNSGNLNNQPASYYLNATNLNAGTISAARLPAGTSSTIGALKVIDSVISTSTTDAASLNSVKTAYDAAGAAYNNAIGWSGNAALAFSNAVANAAAYTDFKSAQAFTNAASYADGKSDTAFSNAVANAKSYADTTLLAYAKLDGTTPFTGAVTVANNLSITNSVFITGNLTVSGTTFYANTTNLDVKDKNITVAKGITDASSADGAGITVDFVNVTWNYDHVTTSWQSNVNITPSINNSKTLGTAALVWSNAHATNVYSTNIFGTIQTVSQPNITANNTTYFGGLFTWASPAALGGTTANSGTFSTLRVNSTLTANAGTGSAGQVLTSAGSSSNAYWKDLPATNLTGSSDASTVTVASSTGTSATVPAASGSVSGIVTAGTQTIGGAKTFSSQPAMPGVNIKGGASDWTVSVVTNSLIFSYGGIAKMKLDTNGNLTVNGDITAFGTI